jgi:signal transduction histidine kinase
MKPTNSGPRRKKILLYYIMAVMLPGIILAYMAYRGIRNDKALREKESRRRLEMNSQAFFAAVDSSLVTFINEHIIDSLLPKLKKCDPSLLAFFVKDAGGSKRLITHQLLYLPADMITVGSEQLSQSIKLKEGIRLEFIEKCYPEALRFYQNKMIKTTNPAEKIQALVASARLYNKMNQHGKAKALYYEILNVYPGSLLNGQIPIGLIAGLEILKINKTYGEHEEIRNNSRQCLELLLHPPSEYDETQFDMFFQSLKEIIPKTDPVIDSLFSKLDIQRARTEYIIQIINESNLIANNNKNFYKNSNYWMSIVPFVSDELSALYLSWENRSSLQRGIVIDFPVYIRSVSDRLIKNLDPDYSINIKIEDNDGKLIFSKVHKEEPGYLYFLFPENLPKWKLLINENKPGFISTLLKEGSGIYLFIFILIALLMVLGFLFTIYSLNMELRLNKLKSEFISNVSHELKSPLTSIRMMTEMLYHNRVLSEERKHEYYSTMLEESEHLSHLIDNILDFSKMDDDRKKYDFIDLDMNELLIKFLESFRERLPEPGFDIRYNPPDRVPVIRADKNAILQVFYNLIDNAIKFSGTSRQIDVSLFPGVDTLLFCVKDYGIGISSKEQEKVFDRFYRGDEPQRLGIKGSGIGLAIVQKIIVAHKGLMTLESKPGEGSTFCVHIPIYKNTGL